MKGVSLVSVVLKAKASERRETFLHWTEEMVAVGGIVRSREPDLEASLHAFADENIPPADQEAFVELARDTLKRLHEGTIARYRIRPSEYEAWRSDPSRAGS